MSRLLQPLVLPPGVAKHSTGLANEGRWVDEDKIRSVNGKPQTIGGWDQIDGEPTLTGVCRGMMLWRTLDDHRLAGFGTHKKLYTYDQGTLTDVTPLRATGTLGTDPFTTTSGSAVVNVEHTAHNVLDGDTVVLSGAAAVGGITIDGSYIATRIDSDNYEITHSSAASSSATGGGASVTYSYEINTGYPSSAFAFGYGVGGYGEGTYGTPRTNALGVLLDARTWTLDVSGEDLVACPRGGSIYLWDYSAGGRAAALTNAPTDNAAVFVTPERAVVAVGAGGDPLKIQWCDIDDRTDWTPAADNTAGDKTVQGGNRLFNGKSLRGGVNLIWSDTELFRMTWLGQEPYYGVRKEGSGAGLMGPHAGIEFDGIGYWMGSNNNFYRYPGFVDPLPNQDDIREHVFAESGAGLDKTQRVKVFAFRNSSEREIWWLYESIDSNGDCNRYVMFDIDESSWHIGTMERTAWLEQPIFPYPIATDADGLVYEHEMGTDAEGAAIRKFVETSPFDLGDGERKMKVKGVYPDFKGQVGNISLYVKTRDAPNASWVTTGPFTLTPTTKRKNTRGVPEAREAAILLESDEVGGKFILGRPTLQLAPGGKRQG